MADPPPAPPARQCPPTIYRSAAGEQAIRSLYDKVLAVLPYEHEERFVETSYGSAHVLVCGPAAAAAQPLVVWHGMGAPAPFILRMLEPLVLSQRFRIYVPDLPYQVGLHEAAEPFICSSLTKLQGTFALPPSTLFSTSSCLPAFLQAGSRTEDALLDPTTHDNGKWCVEVLRGLALLAPPQAGSAAAAPTPPLHVGVSFGAAVIIDLAAVAPEAIRGAVLLVPGGLIPGEGVVPCRGSEWAQGPALVAHSSLLGSGVQRLGPRRTACCSAIHWAAPLRAVQSL